MNMKTALRKLYKAISGDDNYKTNISKLLVDIHYALTGKQPTNKNNHARIISELADNWTGGSGGGGGGGSSDFSTAQVTIVNTAIDATGFLWGTVVTNDSLSIKPIATIGTNVSDAVMFKGSAKWEASGQLYDAIAVSGNITKDGNGTLTITGDCTITISIDPT